MTARSEPSTAGPRPIASVQRVVQVMKLFLESDPDRGLSVTEAARTLNVAKSTVSRMLATLASEGIVTADPVTRRYHVGVLAFQVGSKLKAAQIAGTVRPIIHRLAESSGHTAQMGTVHNSKVLYLVVAESETRLRVVATPGDMRDVHTSSMGKAILAGLPESEQEAVIRPLLDKDGALPPSGPGTIVDLQMFREELRLIEERGFSTSREEATAGVAAIGVRVPGSLPIPLGVSIAFPSTVDLNVEKDELVERVRSAAAEVADTLMPGFEYRRNKEKG